MAKETCVLIIDDDEIILDSCSQVLDKEGYKVGTAKKGETGLRLYKENSYDLVLVDLKMPGKDGIEVLNELKVMDPNCIVIIITGYGTIQSAVEAMKQGAFDFLPKPFTPNELRFMVRRGLEYRRHILEAEFLQQEKIKMRENFVSMVSHELRSPLAAVQQNLLVILGGMAGKISEQAQEILSRMSMRITGLVGLINDWLDLSRIESGEMNVKLSPVNLDDILGEVVDLLLPLAKENKVTLCFTKSNEMRSVLGNKETLQMLFTNLIHNGIKYNQENGNVEVIIKDEEKSIKVIVKDTGIGISKENLPLIFEQFYRVKGGKHIQGSGLGLSIAKKIVEAHAGFIDVQSVLGKGTVFSVCLPYAG